MPRTQEFERPVGGSRRLDPSDEMREARPCLDHIQFGGDIDCAVDFADLEMLLDSWGPCPDCVNCLADLDGDCAVAVPDLLRLLANWG